MPPLPEVGGDTGAEEGAAEGKVVGPLDGSWLGKLVDGVLLEGKVLGAPWLGAPEGESDVDGAEDSVWFDVDTGLNLEGTREGAPLGVAEMF